MTNNLNYFSRLFVFWLLYFFVNRIVFILSYYEKFDLVPVQDVIRIMPKSFSLDVSFIGYLLAIIVILLFCNSFSKNRIVNVFVSYFIYCINIFFIVITALIMAAEIGIYREWQTKLNFTAISHLVNPVEVFSTATYFHYFILLVSIIVAFIFVRLYAILIHRYLVVTSSKLSSVMFRIVSFLILLGVLLLLVRGGVKEIPINTSDAYFSNSMIVNDVTVNSNWNLGQSILKSSVNFSNNPYVKYSEREVEDFLISRYKEVGLINVLNNNRPNIIFILLESWSADNIESLGGLKGITPNFGELEKDGLSFTNFYSNGWTSDQAMSSIFSSFPVFPYVAIINQIDRARRLPCLNKSLASMGYHSSYFFGGQLTYGNIKGYLLAQGFDVVKDGDDFKYLPAGRLGVHDEYMFSQFKSELNDLPEPFMTSLFTLSSHSPFDFPGDHTLSFNSNEDEYINSVAYTDKVLGDFILSVKNEDWYANTLFIIVADHSHNSPKAWRLAQKERFKIPMLWYGDVIKENYKGQICEKLGSQIDLSSTLLRQLGLDFSSYKFGSDMFSDSEPLVPYAFPRGFGLITEKGYYAFSESYNKMLEPMKDDSNQVSMIRKKAEIYFQNAFEEYLICGSPE